MSLGSVKFSYKSSRDVKLNKSSRGVEFDICMSSRVERHQQYVIGECEIPDMSSRGPVVVVHGGAWAVPDSLEVSFVMKIHPGPFQSKRI